MRELKIKEISEITGIKSHTLRYYESVGLIGNINRKSGIRFYTEDDITWINFLVKLKRTGMKISDIKEYADLKIKGYSTVVARKHILSNQVENIESKIRELTETKEYLYKKLDFYSELEQNPSAKWSEEK